jgi:hypothetical protein
MSGGRVALSRHAAQSFSPPWWTIHPHILINSQLRILKKKNGSDYSG